MCNVIFRPLISAAILTAAIASTLQSCSTTPSNDQADADTPVTATSGQSFSARGLLNRAQQAIRAQDFATALQLADSVHKVFPTAIEDRRTALHLAAIAKEGLLSQQLVIADSAVTAARNTGDNNALNNAIKEQNTIRQKLSIARSQVERTRPKAASPK